MSETIAEPRIDQDEETGNIHSNSNNENKDDRDNNDDNGDNRFNIETAYPEKNDTNDNNNGTIIFKKGDKCVIEFLIKNKNGNDELKTFCKPQRILVLSNNSSVFYNCIDEDCEKKNVVNNNNTYEQINPLKDQSNMLNANNKSKGGSLRNKVGKNTRNVTLRRIQKEK